jgi:hypothetical protein
MLMRYPSWLPHVPAQFVGRFANELARLAPPPANGISSTHAIPNDSRHTYHPPIELDIALYWAGRWKETRRHFAKRASSGERRGLFG